MSKFKREFPRLQELEEKANNGVYTHGGVFHADDVFSSALLSLSDICRIEDINRIKNVSEIKENSLVFDIGGGQFDHHQQDARFRKNGNKYAAFGLLWDYVGKEFLNDFFYDEYNENVKEEVVNRMFKKIDEEFITPIDLTDNFGQIEYPNPISYWVKAANARGFDNAVKTAYRIFLDIIISTKAEAEAYVEAKDRLSKIGNANVVFNENKFIPIKTLVEINSNVKCLVSPSPRGGYNLMVAPGIIIPEEVSTISGFTFRHTAGFIASFETVEGAKEAAKLVVDEAIMGVI